MTADYTVRLSDDDRALLTEIRDLLAGSVVQVKKSFADRQRGGARCGDLIEPKDQVRGVNPPTLIDKWAHLDEWLHGVHGDVGIVEDQAQVGDIGHGSESVTAGSAASADSVDLAESEVAKIAGILIDGWVACDRHLAESNRACADCWAEARRGAALIVRALAS